jgi:hypothetical protein
MSITGIRDLDRELLRKIGDSELLKTCSIDKYTWNVVCDDNFIRRRMLAKYPVIEKYKRNESWKRFFVRAVHYISLLKEEYNFEYISGNFIKQYDLVKRYINNKNYLLNKSVKIGELALVIWCLDSGADIHTLNNRCLRYGSELGKLETVKYLIENGDDIQIRDEALLEWESFYKRFEIVKYLVERGANISYEFATKNYEHFEVAKYLKSLI